MTAATLVFPQDFSTDLSEINSLFVQIPNVSKSPYLIGETNILEIQQDPLFFFVFILVLA